MNMVCVEDTCIPMSIRWSVSRLSGICVWENLMCWWVSTCCGKVSIYPRYRWWRYWMPTRKDFYVRIARCSRTWAGMDIMRGVAPEGAMNAWEYARVAEEVIEYTAMPPEKLMKKIKQLEKQMYKHARDLEFEDAARIRYEIIRIRHSGLGLVDKKAG